MKKALAGGALLLGGIFAFAGTASAHNASATCKYGSAQFSANSYPEHSHYNADGGPAVYFTGGFSLTLPGTVAHTVIITSSDEWPVVSLYTPVCVVITTTTPATTVPATTTTMPATTTTQETTTSTSSPSTTSTSPSTTSSTTSVVESSTSTTSTEPSSSSSVPSSSTEPSTSEPSTNVPPRHEEPVPQPEFPKDTCLTIDPVTGIGRTAIYFLPCGPGLNPCADASVSVIPLPDAPENCVIYADRTTTTVAAVEHLPVTGSNAGTTLAVALAAIGAGTGLVVAARRRKAV